MQRGVYVLAAMSAVMISAWVYQRRRDNSGWTDVFWTFGTGAVAAAAALSPTLPPALRQVIVAGMVGSWSLRLGGHMLRRVASSPEDRRYAALRADWGLRFQRRMFSFLLSQAVAGAVLAVAVDVAAHNPAPFGRLQDYAGLALFLIALAGESVADNQLVRFRADPANRGRIADHGLWGWSRHPNYFFEWLAWLAYAPLAIAPGYALGWASLAAAAVMFVVLNFMTGAPLVERVMRASRGEAFEAYAARTSRFFPWPPQQRREIHSTSHGA
jgi:steroid 5-alpha reductase family enzyme